MAVREGKAGPTASTQRSWEERIQQRRAKGGSPREEKSGSLEGAVSRSRAARRRI